MNWVGGVQDHPQAQWPPRKNKLTRLRKVTVLIVMVYYRERYRSEPGKGKVAFTLGWGEVQEKPSTQLPIPETSHEYALNSPSKDGWQHVQSIVNQEVSPQPCLTGFLLRVSHIGMPCHITDFTYSDSNPPRAKSCVHYKSHC